jgi:hypothetical protein
MAPNERRMAIAAVLKDTSLTGSEKQERIKALRPPPSASKRPSLIAKGGNSDFATKRKKIQAIQADKSLAPKEKQQRIQAIINEGK